MKWFLRFIGCALMFLGLAALLVGCPEASSGDEDNGGGGSGLVSPPKGTLVVFSDYYSQNWYSTTTEAPALDIYDATLTITDVATGGASIDDMRTSKYQTYAGTGAAPWAAAGWSFKADSYIDLSSYTSLKFSAKKTSDAGSTTLKMGMEGAKDLAGPGDSDIIVANGLTTKWQEFDIPINDFVKGTFEKEDLKAVRVFKIVLGSASDSVDLDEIRFVTAASTGKSYTVTYNANGGDGTLSKESETVTDGATIADAPTGITLTDNTLTGWNTQADGMGDAFTFGTTTVTADITLYAQWTAAGTSFTVTYNANGGDGTLSKESETVTDGATIADAPTGITLTDNTLTGWNTQADGKGTDFIFGTTKVTADINLFAQWVPFTGVLFDDALQGGFAARQLTDGADEMDAAIDSSVYAGTSGNSIKFELPDAGGWGGGFVQNVSGVDASDYTSLSFSINVSKLDSSVDYMEIKLEDMSGGNNLVDLYSLTPVVAGNWSTYTLYLANYTNVTYSEFKAIGFWHPKAGGASGTYTPGTYYVDDIKFGNDTLSTTHRVTYDANGGEGTLSKREETVEVGKPIADAPTGISRTGYDLTWNTQANGKGTDFVFGETLVTADMTTIYAKWTVEDTVENRYYFLGDATDVGTTEISTSGMTHYGGYDGTITFTEVTDDSAGGADSTTKYHKLVGTAAQVWAAGGWGNGPRIDFTGYDSLVFWAKVPTTGTPATKIKFVLQSQHRADPNGLIGAPIATIPSETNFTPTWAKYEVPFTFFTSEPNFMQAAITEFKYELLGNNHELHIDEMYLKAGSNAPAFAVSAPAVTKDVDSGANANDVIANLLKLTTVTAGATSLKYSITTQSVVDAMSVEEATGILKVADAAQFVYATNTELTATVQVSASDGGTNTDTATIDVTVNIKDVSGPADAATDPATDPADVISVYSDTYKNEATAPKITVSNWNPDWGQATQYSEVDIAGNKVIKLGSLNYQGVEFDGNHDVSTKTKLHIDLWTEDETSFKVSLIAKLVSDANSQGEHAIAVGTITSNDWNSIDIALSEYTTGNTDLDLTKVFQFKFEGSSTGKTVYLDNIYFY